MRQNKRGWKAPSGYHFNERDELIDDMGDIIIDLIIISQICGINDYVPEDVVDLSTTYQSEEVDSLAQTPVEGSEIVADEVTTEPAPVETVSRPEPAVSTPVVETHYTPTDCGSGGSDYSDSGGGDCGGSDD